MGIGVLRVTLSPLRTGMPEVAVEGIGVGLGREPKFEMSMPGEEPELEGVLARRGVLSYTRRSGTSGASGWRGVLPLVGGALRAGVVVGVVTGVLTGRV